MMRDKLFSLLWSVVLSFCIAFGSLMCLTTAFSFDVATVSLALFCVAFAAVSALAFMTRRGSWILGGFLILLGIQLWHTGSLEESVQALLYQISVAYDQAYRWGVVYWSEEAPTMLYVDLALGAAAVLLIWVVTWTVIRRKISIPAIVAGFLPVCACLVVTDRVPSNGSLVLLMVGLLLLILSQTVRRNRETEGNRLTALLLIPALLCTTILFQAIPREDYVPPLPIPQWVEDLFVGTVTENGNGSGGQVVPDISMDLSMVGPKLRGKYVVMEVTAEEGGLLYLRGQAYDVYSGTSWQVASQITEEDRYWPTQNLKGGGRISIRLRGNLSVLYLPYYTNMLQELQYGRHENPYGKEYAIWRMVPNGSPDLEVPVKKDQVVQQCLQLPAETKRQAKEILDELAISARQNDRQKAQIIEEYVKNFAAYDLNTKRMPATEKDFAIWFLQEGETGYCVHYATAATVLLRAAGVPARYVTGYMTQVGNGGTTNVIADEAHAWVEYLDPYRGWTVLDPTPPEPDVEPTEPSAPTEETEPTQGTTPDDQPTDPTDPKGSEEPTEPESVETTVPSGTSVNGGADVPQQEKDYTLLLYSLLALLYIALAVTLLWAQYWIRVHLRRKKMQTGGPNRRALACFREILRLSRLYKQSVPEELEALAEKAKFSQHTLTPEELQVFENRLTELSELLTAKPWYQRILMKLLFAAE